MKNIFNKFLLRLVLLPTSLYKKLDINTSQLKAILTAKLIMDDRRPGGLQKARQSNKDGESTAATLFTMFMSLIMGGLFLTSFIFNEDITIFTFYFSFFILMLSMFLITDFTQVLIDVRDNHIILPKPVNSSTFITARLLHIIIHVIKIITPMALPGLILVTITKGIWGTLVFIPSIAFCTLFTLFIVNVAYLFIMKIFSPEKFNSIITSLQIGFSIAIYGSFQILPRMINKTSLSQIDLNNNIFMFLLPSYWFAGLWKFLYSFSFDIKIISSALMGVLAPAISIWLVIKYFAPVFQRKLSLLSSDTVSYSTTNKNDSKKQSTTSLYTSILSKLFTRSGSERGSFLFTWKMAGRYKEFKMKVYPQIGYMLVMIIMIGMNNLSKINLYDIQNGTSDIRVAFLTITYLSSFLFFGAIFQLPYSDKFSASWLFYTSPLQNPGTVISGAVKAAICKFCIPMMLLVAILGTALLGPGIIPNLLFGFGNILLFCAIVARMSFDEFPFSVERKNMNEGQNTFRGFAMLFLLILVGIPHYFLFNYPLIIGVFSIISFVSAFFVMRNIKQISWKELYQE